MKGITLCGIILIVFGILIISSQGISYTKNEKILDIGPIEATKQTRETIPLPPILGGAAVVGGIVLVITGAKQRP